MKDRSNISDINRPRPRHGHKYRHKYIKYKMGHSMMVVPNQQLKFNLWKS